VFPPCVCFAQVDQDYQGTCLRTECWCPVTADCSTQYGFTGFFTVDFSVANRVSVPSCAYVMVGFGCFTEKPMFGSCEWKDPRISYAVKCRWLVMMDLSIELAEMRK